MKPYFGVRSLRESGAVMAHTYWWDGVGEGGVNEFLSAVSTVRYG
jgi:hypothetical protein